MAVKLNDTLTDTTYFEIDDVPHSKRQYVVSWDSVGGRVAIVPRTIRSDRTVYLVKPTAFSEWTNQAGTPYASFSDLVDAFRTINFFSA